MSVDELVRKYRDIDRDVRERCPDNLPNSTDPTGIWTVEEFGAVLAAAELMSEMETLLREEFDDESCQHLISKPCWNCRRRALLDRIDNAAAR